MPATRKNGVVALFPGAKPIDTVGVGMLGKAFSPCMMMTSFKLYLSQLDYMLCNNLL